MQGSFPKLMMVGLDLGGLEGPGLGCMGDNPSQQF